MSRRLRAGRGTNLALLVVLASALLTGAVAFANGGDWAFWTTAAHGAAGLAVVLLSPWKSVISARGVRRARPGTVASILLGLVVAITVLSGVAHAVGAWTSTSAMQVHVGAAILSIPLVIWHVVARPIRPRRADLSRRSLLRAGAIAGGSVAAFGVVEGLVRATGVRGADRRSTGSYERGSDDPDAMPVTQWLDDAVPEIDAAAWRLEIVMPSGTRSVGFEEIDAHEDRVRATLDCTGGWFAIQDWDGVRLDRLLAPEEGVRSIVVVSTTGFGRRLPVTDAGQLLLATRVGGRPLSAGHGSPARLVAPGRRGFWWVKWVMRIEASRAPWWLQSPFPLT